MAVARGLPIPPPDEIPPELEYKNPPKPAGIKEASDAQDIQHLMVPITSRSQSNNSDGSQGSVPASSLPSVSSPIASGTSTSPLFRTRAKTLAALTTPSRNNSPELTPREMQLPRDPFVNGQPIEAYLYKDADECPICFLYYPPYLNRTRCCDQPICSECFVQIKRPEPHPPDHGEDDPNAASQNPEANQAEECQLVSEPASCPFCVQPELGVTYVPPPFRRGLTYASDLSGRPNIGSPMSSSSSLSSGNVGAPGRRRATSLSATDPAVVTTDRIRPDWAQKLANARAHAARRSAAATALHTAAYMMNPNQSDSRNLLGRRGVMRRGTGESQTSGRGSPALNALAFLTERRGTGGQEADSAEEGNGNLAPPRGSSRRNRIDDLEEMMMMEAIRLSLASEEERRKKEEKEFKKEAKRREKDAKKADKAARKNGLYSNNASSSCLDLPPNGRLGRVMSSSSSVADEGPSSAGKGKGVERGSPSATDAALDQSSGVSTGNASPIPTPVGATDQKPAMATGVQPPPMEPAKRSHLRHVSSASSFSSSIVESSSDDRGAPYASGNASNPSIEPMFNFRSLAAVIGNEEKGDESAEHVEHTSTGRQDEEASASEAIPKSQASTKPVDSGQIGSDVVEAKESPQEDNSFTPKELETRSVEITSATQNAEAQS